VDRHVHGADMTEADWSVIAEPLRLAYGWLEKANILELV
jgi:hypothetical protein